MDQAIGAVEPVRVLVASPLDLSSHFVAAMTVHWITSYPFRIDSDIGPLHHRFC